MTEITTPTPTWIPTPANARTDRRTGRRSSARRTSRRHTGSARPFHRLARRLADHVPTSATPSDRALAGIGHIERHLR